MEQSPNPLTNDPAQGKEAAPFPANSGASLFVPDGRPFTAALRSATHLAIGAHQDDIEIMAFHGISHCLGSHTDAFAGVVCTDGAGSPRAHPTAPDDLRAVRREEQNAAARRGGYRAMVQLDYKSADLRGARRSLLEADLLHLLREGRPQVLYTHNPFDAHPTHIAVCQAAISALRALPPSQRPQAVYGCEVWRSLDWVPARYLRTLTWAAPDERWVQLLACFASQIQGGKRYDLAAVGRAQANATFREPHQIDRSQAAWLAVDLRPLLDEPDLSIEAYVQAVLDEFGSTLHAALRHKPETP